MCRRRTSRQTYHVRSDGVEMDMNRVDVYEVRCPDGRGDEEVAGFVWFHFGFSGRLGEFLGV